jgi:flagellar hook assembly protein FlgD
MDDLDYSSEKALEVPSIHTFTMGQNYPNPFRDQTTIFYELPDDADVHVCVLDLLGQEIITLRDSRQAEGGYTVDWNGRDRAGQKLPAGIYFYRITVKSGTELVQQTGKMLLLD